jgi:hypothetical protein
MGILPGVVIRSDESHAVADFLGATEHIRQCSSSKAKRASARRRCGWGPWKRHERGFACSRRAGQAESGLAFAVLADLLVGIEPAVLDGLPHLSASPRPRAAP